MNAHALKHRALARRFIRIHTNCYCDIASPLLGVVAGLPGITSGCLSWGAACDGAAPACAVLAPAPLTYCLKSAPASHGFGLQPSEPSQCAEKPIVAVPSGFTARVI